MNISLRRCVRSLSSSIIPSRLGNGPSLKEFLDSAVTSPSSSPSQSTSIFDQNINIDQDQEVATNAGLKFYIETYGCQMNTSDSEIVRSILLTKGHVFCEDIDSADLILTNTCAIRENAENKVWHRLQFFQSMKSKSKQKIKSTVDSSSNSNNNSNNINNKSNQRSSGFPIVGVLGCMAERLKTKLLEEKAVDFVCGPDAYRDIPRLLDTVLSSGQKEANTRLSLDETYADIEPVRATNSASAFVSIMRGCNNMCAFCIVPFTRGRERSREHASILQEVAQLSEQGVREVVLLGQNVNGYHDITIQSSIESHPLKDNANTKYQASPGFKNMFHSRVKDQAGVRFADLLRDVAAVDPEIRVRFTSPHPKDFPPEVLDAIASTHNICKSIHLPVQSGSSNCLERMRRGYTREAFLSLVDNMRTLMPQLTLSTDVIAGFCGETDAEHADTVSLMRQVAFDQAFMFAYSLRDKTHAAHTMEDNVPEELKLKRLQEIIAVFRENMLIRNKQTEDGRIRLVLIEGMSSKATAEEAVPLMTGRTDGNKRVLFNTIPSQLLFTPFDHTHLRRVQSIFKKTPNASDIFTTNTAIEDDVNDLYAHLLDEPKSASHTLDGTTNSNINSQRYATVDELRGKYAVVHMYNANGQTLRGRVLGLTSMKDFHHTLYPSLLAE